MAALGANHLRGSGDPGTLHMSAIGPYGGNGGSGVDLYRRPRRGCIENEGLGMPALVSKRDFRSLFVNVCERGWVDVDCAKCRAHESQRVTWARLRPEAGVALKWLRFVVLFWGFCLICSGVRLCPHEGLNRPGYEGLVSWFLVELQGWARRRD